MSIFGNLDAKALANNVTVTNGDATVTLASGSFLNKATANYIVAGDILSLSGVQYVVKSVTDATNLELHKPYAGSSGTVTSANAIRRTAPKAVAYYVINGGDTNTGSLIYIDRDEAQLNENKIRGLSSPGWWVYKTYVDTAGSTRHKSECIASVIYASADPTVTGDFDNDNPAADIASAISIGTQPTNQTTYAPAGAILTVTSSGTAATGTGSYTITNSSAGVTVANVSGGAAPSGTWSLGVSRSGGTYTVTVNTGGANFAATDTITIPGDLLGGVVTTNDLVVTVATVATAAATFTVSASVTSGSLTYQWQVQTATSTTKWTNVAGATSASLALTGLATTDSGKKYRVKLGATAGAEEVISNTATLTVTAA